MKTQNKPVEKKKLQIQKPQLNPLKGGRKLKVRNLDETKVTNEELRVRFINLIS